MLEAGFDGCADYYYYTIFSGFVKQIGPFSSKFPKYFGEALGRVLRASSKQASEYPPTCPNGQERPEMGQFPAFKIEGRFAARRGLRGVGRREGDFKSAVRNIKIIFFFLRS